MITRGKLAFVGRRGLGGVEMRGRDVAKRMGVPFLTERELLPDEWETLVLVKYWDHGPSVRAAARRLIFDPLDCWSSSKRWYHERAEAFWKWTWDELRYDAVVATSPSCEESMFGGLAGHARVFLSPHHADPRVSRGWWEPDGPVVYAGGARYVNSAVGVIRRACENLGRNLVLHTDHDATFLSIRGASCVLHPRCAPHDTDLNRRCKPQVKLENALATGIPIVATDCECVTSLRPIISTVRHEDAGSVAAWQNAILNEIASGPCRGEAFTIEDHVAEIRDIVKRIK